MRDGATRLSLHGYLPTRRVCMQSCFLLCTPFVMRCMTVWFVLFASVFHEFGEIVEVVILRDRRTNMHQVSDWCPFFVCALADERLVPLDTPCRRPQGCCFVKFSSLLSAQAAINALHNQRSLPPLRNPLQVRFADSAVNATDRGQTNTENKLFVGGVPSGCGDKELRMLFHTYGEVLDVYILASKSSQVLTVRFLTCRHVHVRWRLLAQYVEGVSACIAFRRFCTWSHERLRLFTGGSTWLCFCSLRFPTLMRNGHRSFARQVCYEGRGAAIGRALRRPTKVPAWRNGAERRIRAEWSGIFPS